MFGKSNIPVWIGMLLMASFFMMGQAWNGVCDWITDTTKVYTDCNVGIGTTNPDGKLHVAEGDAIFEGNVGVGIANLTEGLNIAQNGDGELITYSSGTDPGDFGHYSAAFGTAALGGGNQDTGMNINGSAMGRAYLIMVTTSWSDGAATAAALYFVKCGYDGDNMTAYPISGDTGTFTLSQQNGHIYIDSIFGKMVTWWRLS